MSGVGKVRRARRDEDAEAILSRRRFLIESAVAGAGLGALAAGCAEEERARPCLSVMVKELPKPGTATSPQPCLEVAPPQPCLDVAPPPEACLSVAPPPEPKEGQGPPPQPCLSLPPPKPCLRIAPQPKVCLSLEEVK